MSIETIVYAALKDLVPLGDGTGKVYPDMNDEGTAAPYIVHTRAGGPTPGFLENASPSKEATRLRVTCWDVTRIAAQALAKQVQDTLVALTSVSARPLGSTVSLVDPETALRGASQDFIVWADR